MDLVELLHASPITAGLIIRDDRVAPIPGTFTPVGVCWHHTAGRGTALNVVKYGRSDLRGPLCNVLIQRSGAVRVTCDGRANDTGYGSSTVLDEVMRDVGPGADAYARDLRDDVGLSRWFYDIEVDNDGIGEPYPFAQVDALVRVSAALLVAHRWSVNRCRHHRQLTRRKPDMSHRGDLWHPTALHALAGATNPPAPGGSTVSSLDAIAADVAAIKDGLVDQFPGPGGRSHNHGFAIQAANGGVVRIEAKLATIAGELAVVRRMAEEAATPEEVAEVVDSALEAILDALVGLPDPAGGTVDRETVRRLLIELLEAAG